MALENFFDLGAGLVEVFRCDGKRGGPDNHRRVSKRIGGFRLLGFSGGLSVEISSYALASDGTRCCRGKPLRETVLVFSNFDPAADKAFRFARLRARSLIAMRPYLGPRIRAVASRRSNFGEVSVVVARDEQERPNDQNR